MRRVRYRKPCHEIFSFDYRGVDSLQQVVNVINGAAAATNDKTRTIRESMILKKLL